MDRLAAAFETIAAEVKMIREILDRLADNFDWALNNRQFQRDADPTPQIAPLTNMPLDPLATDWNERVNRYSVADLPDAEGAEPVAPRAEGQPSQGQLW